MLLFAHQKRNGLVQGMEILCVCLRDVAVPVLIFIATLVEEARLVTKTVDAIVRIQAFSCNQLVALFLHAGGIMPLRLDERDCLFAQTLYLRNRSTVIAEQWFFIRIVNIHAEVIPDSDNKRIRCYDKCILLLLNRKSGLNCLFPLNCL